MTVQLQRIQSTSPLVTNINSRVADDVKSAILGSKGWWDVNDIAYTGTSDNDIETFIIPRPPSFPRQVIPGAHWPIETSALGSVTTIAKTYATGVEIGIFNEQNPQVKNYHDWVKQVLAGYGEEHCRLLIGQLFATNPTLTNYDGVAMFSASHPVDPFNPARTTPAGSATWSNTNSSKPFNLTNLLFGINAIHQLAWPNGAPFKPKNFKLWLPSGVDLAKASHILSGSMLGGSLVLTGSADVGANSNPFAALQSRLGITIEVCPIHEYTTVAGATANTDWYLTHELIKPAVLFFRQPHKLVELNSDTDYPVFYEMRKECKLQASLHLGFTHPLSIFKFTA